MLGVNATKKVPSTGKFTVTLLICGLPVSTIVHKIYATARRGHTVRKMTVHTLAALSGAPGSRGLLTRKKTGKQ